MQVDLETTLAKLREQRAEIDAAIEALERLTGEETGGRRSRVARVSRDEDSPTLSGRIVHVLRSASQPLKASEIVEELERSGVASESKNFYSTVYTALRRERERGRVEQLDNKEWTLAAEQ